MTKVDENLNTAKKMLSWIVERCYELEEENKKLKETIEYYKEKCEFLNKVIVKYEEEK